MSLRLLFIGTTILFLAAGADARGQEEPVRKPGPHPPSQELKNPFEYEEKTIVSGRRIYQRMCVTCHGLDGKGKTETVEAMDVKPGDFTAREFRYGQTDGEIFTLIRDGSSEGMAPYGNTLKERQIWHLVHYIRSLGPADTHADVEVAAEEVLENPIEYSKASISRGKQFYARFCIKCHGANGKGDTEMREFLKTLPSDLTDGQWIYGEQDGQIFKIIKEGTDNDMEAFADRLVDERIWHVVNYLKSLNPKTD